MERYLGDKGSSYSSKTMRLLFPMYGLFLLTALSLLIQAYEEISAGRTLTGE